MTNWKPITELPPEQLDGRPVLLWTDWSESRARYPTSTEFTDVPVCARWKRDGWHLTETGEGAYDDEVLGSPAYWAEITAPQRGGA